MIDLRKHMIDKHGWNTTTANPRFWSDYEVASQHDGYHGAQAEHLDHHHPKQLTADEFLAFTEAEFPFDQVNIWLQRGDGIAVYENKELGHPMLGHRVFVSFGSPAAQIETDEVPDRLPDGLFAVITGGINWRYRLDGVYQGEPFAGSETLDLIDENEE